MSPGINGLGVRHPQLRAVLLCHFHLTSAIALCWARYLRVNSLSCASSSLSTTVETGDGSFSFTSRHGDRLY